MKDKQCLYQQIYETLKEKIVQGMYQPNEKLPSEAELQKQFKTSRITVRRALQELELAGLVLRQHGKGTIVNTKKVVSNLVGVSGFNVETAKMGERASSIILDFYEGKSNALVSEYLQVPLHSPVYFLKRLRLKNGRIAGIHETYISKIRGLVIRHSDLDEHTSIYELYSRNGLEIQRATETIEAKIASKQICNDLHLMDGDAVFLRERITYLDNNEPIEFSINTYRADEYKYVINLVKDN